MRLVIATFGLLLVACGQPTTPASREASTTSAATPPAATASAFEPEALVGAWSFDRSCASGDGMTLNADSTASYDEWGEGHWVVDAPSRLIITLAKSEPGVGPTGQHVMVTIDVTPPVADDLNGTRAFDDGTPSGPINARRCPEPQ
jgi:hypothetical protein